jgi:hypothetical protein
MAKLKVKAVRDEFDPEAEPTNESLKKMEAVAARIFMGDMDEDDDDIRYHLPE